MNTISQAFHSNNWMPGLFNCPFDVIKKIKKVLKSINLTPTKGQWIASVAINNNKSLSPDTTDLLISLGVWAAMRLSFSFSYQTHTPFYLPVMAD